MTVWLALLLSALILFAVAAYLRGGVDRRWGHSRPQGADRVWGLLGTVLAAAAVLLLLASVWAGVR